MQMPSDAQLTDFVKQKIAEMIQVRDNGTIGAFMLYLEDKDIEGFKARTIHKAVASESREGNPGAALSSATTAGF